MPEKAQAVIFSKKREKVLEGGRGSGKSYSFADMLLLRASTEKLRILCTRETQRSIKDSVHRLLSDRIQALKLTEFFKIQRDLITSTTGSDFIFKGLRHNIAEIKSTEGIDICWCEEAEKISEDSWTVLIPTIRKEGSEIWISFNQEDKNSATRNRFVLNPAPHCITAHMTYRDNLYFPEVLRQEMEYDRVNDPAKYDHVWEGGCKEYHDALIFGDRIHKEAFETPTCVVKHYGCDWGFSGAPMAIHSMFILDKDLYIDYEFYAHGIDYDDYVAAFDTIPGIREGRIRADNSQPASISYMKRHGFDILGAKKGPGSIEDGIKFLRSFRRIVIHERCAGAWDDFSNYRWKQDAQTKEILNIPVDKCNHVPDNVRYALEPMIRMRRRAVAV